MCHLAETGPVNPTMMHYQKSTKFWKLKFLIEETIRLFTRHMGHDRTIHKEIYSATQAMKTIQVIAPLLLGGLYVTEGGCLFGVG